MNPSDNYMNNPLGDPGSTGMRFLCDVRIRLRVGWFDDGVGMDIHMAATQLVG